MYYCPLSQVMYCLEFHFGLYFLFIYINSLHIYSITWIMLCYFALSLLVKMYDLLGNGILKQVLGFETTNPVLCHFSCSFNYKLFSLWANNLTFLEWDLLSLKLGWYSTCISQSCFEDKVEQFTWKYFVNCRVPGKW